MPLPFLRRGSVLKRSDFSISSDDLVAPLSLTLLKGESPTALCSITLRSEGTAIRKVEGLHVMSLKARDTAEYSGSTDGKKEDLLEAISASEKKSISHFFWSVLFGVWDHDWRLSCSPLCFWIISRKDAQNDVLFVDYLIFSHVYTGAMNLANPVVWEGRA